jgi:hypothetical protein
VAWPQRDEKADSGMAFTIGFSSQYLRFHGCLCWLMLRWITPGLQQFAASSTKHLAVGMLQTFMQALTSQKPPLGSLVR